MQQPLTKLELLAPAKINLFLHITGRRSDGYHQLQTVFQLLDYGDQLIFEVNQQPEINLKSNCDDINPEDNLVIKAARLLQEQSNQKLGASIQLNKILPVGGGLGGGSSNAATTLLALNKLWQCNFSLTQLATLGLQLGADVPVFVHGHTAWGQGIGEILSPMQLPETWFLVITPPCHVSTHEIFCHEQLTRNTSPLRIARFPIPSVKNDCEKVAILLYPEIGNGLKWLAQYAKPSMTGTGASIFANFDTKEAAVQVLKSLPESFTGFVAQGVNTSPLHLSLERL